MRGAITTPWCATSIRRSPSSLRTSSLACSTSSRASSSRSARPPNAKCPRSASAERTSSLAHMKVLCRILLAGVLAFTLAGAAAARQLVIRQFDAQILINADGTIDVTENITAQFIGSNWHGLYRTIPVEYTTPQGLNYSLFLRVLSVTDSNGQKLKYEESQDRKS